MNKLALLALAAICSLSSAVDSSTCSLAGNNDKIFNKTDFVDMKDGCVSATEKQIKKEILASMNYLSMAAFFSKDEINRPGFAKLFFEAAGEEREHAYKLIEYLSMRGRYQLDKTGQSITLDFDFKKIVGGFNDTSLYPGIEIEPLQKAYFKVDDTTKALAKDKDRTSGLVALKNALKLETFVTKSIRELIATCENEKTNGNNDYHFVDYLTSDFLDEQYKGQRDLAGKISTLAKMVKGHGNELGEFLFDKQLL